MMFKRLRNKILITNMLIISAMLAVSFSVIYLITMQNTARDINDRLFQSIRQVYASQVSHPDDGPHGRGARPEGGESVQDIPADMTQDEFADIPADMPAASGIPEEAPISTGDPQPFSRPEDIPREMAARFEVVTDKDGNVIRVNSPFEVTDESYKEEIPDIISSDDPFGFIQYSGGIWSYLFIPSEDGYIFAFGDTTAEQTMLRQLIVILLLVGLAALCIIFFISLVTANRSIRPVEESYNKQKQFVADASHELKTPLTTINTNADVLLSHGESTINEERKWLEYIKSETLRMTKLTDDLLCLARLDHGTNEDEKPCASWSEAAENIILTMEAVIFEKNINFTYDIEPGINVAASSVQLKQLVMILLDNAVKYTHSGGEINMTLKRSKNSCAVMTVRNTGEGIAPEDMGHIFERFYRADKSRSRDSGGYGLGLAIAKAAAEYAGGEIGVKSKAGEWTEFFVKLPEK